MLWDMTDLQPVDVEGLHVHADLDLLLCFDLAHTKKTRNDREKRKLVTASTESEGH